MILLDTAGLLCFYDHADARHADAVTFYRAEPHKFTHNYVLAELVILAQTRRLPRRPVLDFIAGTVKDPQVAIIWVDQALHDEAMNLLRQQLDKAYSLCDAVSFVLMQKRGLTEALTTDHHFTQAGFHALLSA